MLFGTFMSHINEKDFKGFLLNFYSCSTEHEVVSDKSLYTKICFKPTTDVKKRTEVKKKWVAYPLGYFIPKNKINKAAAAVIAEMLNRNEDIKVEITRSIKKNDVDVTINGNAVVPKAKEKKEKEKSAASSTKKDAKKPSKKNTKKKKQVVDVSI